MKKIAVTFFSLFLFFLLTNLAWTLSGQNVVALKKAGVKIKYTGNNRTYLKVFLQS